MSLLFEPITIGTATLRNRIALPPMVRFAPPMSPEITNTGGEITDRVIEHYRQRAAGMGMITVEATCIDPGGRTWANGLNAHADEHLPGLARLAAAIRAEGCLACVQIVHGGPHASTELVGQTVGPSAVRPSPSAPLPRELTLAEIGAIRQRFVEGADRVVRAGFQAVDLHGAHGYLLDSFLSAARNQRTDIYGGDIAGRVRLMAETCAQVVAAVGSRALVGCRFSLFNKQPGEIGLEETRVVVNALAAAGLDFLDLSSGGVFKPWFGESRGIGQWVKSLTDLPVIVAGDLVTPQDAERALAEGHGDVTAIGRAALSDPQWAEHARATLEPR